MERGLTWVEPSEEAQLAWVHHLRETAVDISQLQRECTPSYFNNEGEARHDAEGGQTYRWYLGESYGPGWGRLPEAAAGLAGPGNAGGPDPPGTSERGDGKSGAALPR